MNEKSTLDAWAEKYCPDANGTWVIFKGYNKDIFGKAWTAGICYYFSDGHSEIYINSKLENHSFLSRVALWHEFCHAWAYVEGENPSDWSRPFMNRLLKKPLYFLAQFAMALLWPAL